MMACSLRLVACSFSSSVVPTPLRALPASVVKSRNEIEIDYGDALLPLRRATRDAKHLFFIFSVFVLDMADCACYHYRALWHSPAL